MVTQQEIKTIDKELLKSMPLPEYGDDADKADYGKLLIIAGSRRLPGAAILAARAALRSGCGTVRVATPASIATAIGVAVPELMVLPLPEASSGALSSDSLTVLREQFEACDAVVVGPGMDESKETSQVILEILGGCPLPILVDAQALVALGARDNAATELTQGEGPRVFTPNLAEMMSLTGLSSAHIEANRGGVSLHFAREGKCTLLLKGRETIIASPSGEMYQNDAGTRGVGTAGSGDVLAGIIGSLLAQKLDATKAAVWGAHIHGLAGESESKDAGDDGLIASDLVHGLPAVLRYLRRTTLPKKESERGGLRR